MVVVNCCRCFEGVNLDREIHVQCFACGHHLGGCCPGVGEPKPGHMAMNAFETGTNSSSPDTSVIDSTASSWKICSHGSYHNGYHYRK